MVNVVLAGQYPAGTYEKLRAMLPEEQFGLKAVNAPGAYDAMTDAEIMILRIFKAPKGFENAQVHDFRIGHGWRL